MLFAAGSTWAEHLARTARWGAPASWGRWPRLALTAVALRLLEPEAVAYLRAESLRFFTTLPARSTDTASLAAEGLLRARDPVAIEQMAGAIASAPPHTGTTRSLLRIAGSDAAFASVLDALNERGRGGTLAG